MLFAQQNGLEAPVEDSTEAGVVQKLACGFGPNVDGIAASRSLPQAMGAFVTAGAQGACAGRGQQAEQHGPTTMHLGQTATVAPTTSTTSTTTRLPTTFIQKLAVMDPALLSKTAATAIKTAEAAPATPPTPTTLVPTSDQTVPAGTITAFSAKTNMWRVAVPTVPAGLGIFGATPAFTEQASQPAPPAGATQVPEKEFEAKTGQLPLYKRPLFWAIVGGSVVVLLGGGALIIRSRRRRAAAPAAAAPKAAYY